MKRTYFHLQFPFFLPPQICEAFLLNLLGSVCGDDVVKYGELHAGLAFVLQGKKAASVKWLLILAAEQPCRVVIIST